LQNRAAAMPARFDDSTKGWRMREIISPDGVEKNLNVADMIWKTYIYFVFVTNFITTVDYASARERRRLITKEHQSFKRLHLSFYWSWANIPERQERPTAFFGISGDTLMHPSPSTLSPGHSKAAAVFRVTAGNFLEQFDFFLFGFYATQIAKVMPAQVRVAGFSLAYSLATAVFGGFTPAISTALIHMTNDKAAPGYWLSFAAACALFATLALYRRSAAKLTPAH
jgi:hypothetical protein